MWRNILIALAVSCCVLLAACGGSTSSTPMASSNSIPMSLTIGDTPPTGVAVLFFEVSITGATLQPSDSKKAAVTVMTTPVEVEFGHLQTDTAFLSLANVAADTYSSLTLIFANPVLTVVNHSTAPGMCAINAVCQLTPSLNSSSVTLSAAPFPITLDADSVFGLKLDLNVNSSVQGDLSITPAVTVAQVTHRHNSDEGMEMENLDEVDGQVTALGTNQFTLMNARSGQSFTISVDGNTTFQDFDRAGCTATPSDFTCVKTGQILDVDLSENGTGTTLAKRVEFEENASEQVIKGTITSVDSTTQFHIVVFNEEPEANMISEGSQVVVTIAPNAIFQVGREEMGEFGGFDIFGFRFASGADLLVGQDVQVRPGTVTSTGGITVTTDLVRLWPSQITGQVGSIDSGHGTFTLTNLSPLFTGATPPINTITVQTLPEMDLMDFLNGNSPAVGDTVSVKGLLFNTTGTTGTPTLVTRSIRDHHDDQGSH